MKIIFEKFLALGKQAIVFFTKQANKIYVLSQILLSANLKNDFRDFFAVTPPPQHYSEKNRIKIAKMAYVILSKLLIILNTIASKCLNICMLVPLKL